MRIFLTGGTGFIGSYFLKLALAAGHEVVALKRAGSEPVIPLPQQPQWLVAPLDGVPETSLVGCDALVHLAAHGVSNPQSSSWDECFRWNVTASLDLWQKASSAGISRFIIAGSCFEYGLSAESYDNIPSDAPLVPTGPYHSSKAAATMAALGLSVDRSLELLILRPFHIFGLGEGASRFWPSLKAAATDGRDFPMTDGEQLRDFMHVEAAALKFLHAVNRSDLQKGSPLIENLGSGQPRRLIDFATAEWNKFQASGKLIPGAMKHRENEVMRYVPELPSKQTF